MGRIGCVLQNGGGQQTGESCCVEKDGEGERRSGAASLYERNGPYRRWGVRLIEAWAWVGWRGASCGRLRGEGREGREGWDGIGCNAMRCDGM